MITDDLDSLMTINLNGMAKFNGVVDPDVCFGYTVIGDMLVSNSFMKRLEVHLDSIELKYGTVFSARKLCGDKFFNSLTDEERLVLAPCILVLIDEGGIRMNFAGAERNGQVQPARAYGHFLSTECDLPEPLFDLLKESLAKARFDHDRVLLPRKALGAETWNTLNEKDQDALRRCMLIKLSDDHVHLYPVDSSS